MIRRSLTLGVPLTLGMILLVSSVQLTWEAKTAIFAIVVIGLAIEIAQTTTAKAAHYGASGMVAGMATMMAAMGTGLSLGYATGMIWDLGWANLVGVLAGLTHGLVMGRRYGPMAALDGAGGGVMGGLMGPMLGVMLLYLPTSLVLTALLMLALQAAFSLGGVYLMATAAGAVASSGWLHQVGHVLGSQYQEVACCPLEAAAPPALTGKRPKTRQGTSKGDTERRSWVVTLVAALAGALSVLVIGGTLSSDLFRGRSASAPLARSDGPTGAPAGEPAAALAEQDGVQQLAMTLRYPRYEPRLMEVKVGVPVRLTLQAIGDPG